MKRRMCLFGFHDQNAPRQRNINRTLTQEGWWLCDCHTRKKGFIAKLRDLHGQLHTCDHWEALFVTFPGQYLVPFARVCAPHKRIFFDAFLSLYDSQVCDRGQVSRWNPYAWFLWCMDWLSCRLADEVWIDTEEHKKYFSRTFHVPMEKIRVHYLGTRDDLFFPTERKKNVRPEVLFYGSYIPLQGIGYILDAAALLPDVHFTLIGKGQTYAEMRERAKVLPNVSLADPVPLYALPDCIRSTDVCLGIFGTGAKTQRVIPHKVYDAVACGIPVITADTPAIREQFADDPLVILCQAGNGRAIADAISGLIR